MSDLHVFVAGEKVDYRQVNDNFDAIDKAAIGQYTDTNCTSAVILDKVGNKIITNEELTQQDGNNLVLGKYVTVKNSVATRTIADMITIGNSSTTYALGTSMTINNSANNILAGKNHTFDNVHETLGVSWNTFGAGTTSVSNSVIIGKELVTSNANTIVQLGTGSMITKTDENYLSSDFNLVLSYSNSPNTVKVDGCTTTTVISGGYNPTCVANSHDCTTVASSTQLTNFDQSVALGTNINVSPYNSNNIMQSFYGAVCIGNGISISNSAGGCSILIGSDISHSNSCGYASTDLFALGRQINQSNGASHIAIGEGITSNTRSTYSTYLGHYIVDVSNGSGQSVLIGDEIYSSDTSAVIIGTHIGPSFAFDDIMADIDNNNPVSLSTSRLMVGIGNDIESNQWSYAIGHNIQFNDQTDGSRDINIAYGSDIKSNTKCTSIFIGSHINATSGTNTEEALGWLKVIGSNCTLGNNSSYCNLLGHGLISDYQNQTILGKYNENKANSLFEIGDGVSNEERHTLFRITKDGKVYVNDTELGTGGGGTSTVTSKPTISSTYTIRSNSWERDTVTDGYTQSVAMTLDVNKVNQIIYDLDCYDKLADFEIRPTYESATYITFFSPTNIPTSDITFKIMSVEVE